MLGKTYLKLAHLLLAKSVLTYITHTDTHSSKGTDS